MSSPTSPGQPSKGDQRLTWQAIFLVLLTCLLWGGNPVAVRFAAENLGPLTIASLRFMMASACLYLWCRATGVTVTLNRKSAGWVLVGGVLLCLQIGLFHLGIDRSNASHATILINTYVFWVMVIESLLLRLTRLEWPKLIGLMSAGIGTAVIILTNLDSPSSSSGDQPGLLGDLLLFASGFTLALKILLTKVAVKSIPSASFIFWHDLIGCFLLIFFCCLFEPLPEWEYFNSVVIMSLIYQGVCVAGFCFAMQAYLLQTYSATRIAIFSFTSPIFGVCLGVLLRGDKLSVWFSGAVVLVAVGIYLVNKPGKSDRFQ